MSHGQAIINQHRDARIKSASGKAEIKLAEIEKAALAFRDKVLREKEHAMKEGRYTEATISDQVVKRAHQWLAERKQFDDLIESIDKVIAVDTPVKLPERTETHREICAHFRTLTGDKRQEAIARAIAGHDKELAEALATEPQSTSTLMDFDRDLIIKRMTPENALNDQARVADLKTRIAATRATLQEVTTTISGASK